MSVPETGKIQYEKELEFVQWAGRKKMRNFKLKRRSTKKPILRQSALHKQQETERIESSTF